MIVFPGCKINLGLRVVSRRNDGYHDIETVFCPVAFSDVLEVAYNSAGKDELTVTGVPLPGKAGENICWKALGLLRSGYSFPPLKICLHKIVPPGSGLGGGSADGAALLKAVNRLAGLNINDDALRSMAGSLGADCAFFVSKRPVLAKGIGDIFSDVKLPQRLAVVVVIPPVQVNTAWAYSALSLLPKQGLNVDQALALPLRDWKSNLYNDFELPVFNKYPMIGTIKETLYKMGAAYASLSGSGSAVYGLFSELPASRIDFPGSLVYSGILDS